MCMRVHFVLFSFALLCMCARAYVCLCVCSSDVVIPLPQLAFHSLVLFRKMQADFLFLILVGVVGVEGGGGEYCFNSKRNYPIILLPVQKKKKKKLFLQMYMQVTYM